LDFRLRFRAHRSRDSRSSSPSVNHATGSRKNSIFYKPSTTRKYPRNVLPLLLLLLLLQLLQLLQLPLQLLIQLLLLPLSWDRLTMVRRRFVLDGTKSKIVRSNKTNTAIYIYTRYSSVRWNARACNDVSRCLWVGGWGITTPTITTAVTVTAVDIVARAAVNLVGYNFATHYHSEITVVCCIHVGGGEQQARIRG